VLALARAQERSLRSATVTSAALRRLRGALEGSGRMRGIFSEFDCRTVKTQRVQTAGQANSR